MKITTLDNLRTNALGRDINDDVSYIPAATMAVLKANYDAVITADGQVKRAEHDLPEAVDTAENFLMAILLREDGGLPVRKGFSAYYVVAKPHTTFAGTKTFYTEEYIAEDFEGLDYAAAVEATKAICCCYSAAFWDYVKGSSKLKVLTTDSQVGHDSLRYGIDPDNLGYEIVIKGGTLLSFHPGWFGAGWLNEVSVRLHLPDRAKDTQSNEYLHGVLNGVRDVIKAAVPYENLANDDIDIADISDYINKTLENYQQALLTSGTTTPFKNSWWFYVEGDNYEPVEIIIRPVLRDALRGFV